MNKIKRTILNILDEKIGFIPGLEIVEKPNDEFNFFLNDKLLETLSLKEIYLTGEKAFEDYICKTKFFNSLK